MITEKMLYMKLYNHNAWTNGTLLDIDSLGASGDMGDHLILFNTQEYLCSLSTKSELWDFLGAIGTYEYKNGLQRKTPIKIFLDEYKRIDKGGKIDASFMYDLTHARNDFGKVVKGRGFKK